MSIKGIDTQIMISRLPDNARDTSALLKRPEVFQDTLAAQTKVNDAQEQSKVIKTTESEMEEIRADVEGGSGGAAGSGGGAGHNEDEQNDELEPGTYVPAEKHFIDITV